MILLTGASGFLGRHVLRLVIQAGYDVIVFGRRALESVGGTNIRIVVGDLASGAGMTDIPWEKLDGVIHLAASGVKASRRSWANAVDTNIVGTQRLLSYISGNALRNPAVFVARTFYEDVLVDAPALRDNPYIVTKAAATQLVRLWSTRYSGLVTLGSIFQLYGPGDDQNSVLSYSARCLKALQPCLLGSGRNLRDWLYVEDAAHAVVATIQAPTAGVIECDIGSGTLCSIADMVHRLANIAGADEGLLKFDATRDRNDVGLEIVARRFPANWRPRTTAIDGLKYLYEST